MPYSRVVSGADTGKERHLMNVKTLVGMPVLAVDAGKNLGTVDRVLFSPEKQRIEGFVVTRQGGLMDEPEPQRIIAVDKLHGVGHDAITVDSEDLLETLADGQFPAGLVAFDEIEREKVMTEGGEEVGEVSSIDFDEQSFQIDFIEVGRGFLSGSSLISVEHIVSVGEDVIVVRDAALDDPGPDENIVDENV